VISKSKFISKPYISILFLKDAKVGFLLLALTFLLPSVGFMGIVAILVTIAFAEFINVRDEYLKYGFYLYNSLLVGMGVGYYYEITYATLILTAILSIFTFLVSFGLNRVFIKYSLPLLSMPFATVSMFFYLASLKYTTLFSNVLNRSPLFDITLPFEPFFKSLGTIFFMPYTVAGVVIAAILLLYSRALFLSAITGFIVGVFAHSFFVPFNISLNSPYNFNFILISMAISGVFLLPHYKSIILAAVAVVVSVILIDSMEVFFNIFALPVYTMPFNIITILFILLLSSVGYKYFNHNIQETPEKSLSYHLSNIYRFGGNDIKVALPFNGTWSVYQAFNGEWTHKGAWRFAYDFVIRKNGKTYKNEGHFLEDYYAFGQSVVSPVSGYVVATKDDLEDNFIGNVDRLNNWGNYIIIHSDYGYYVEISHLMKDSMLVKVGDYVQMGQIVAKCGNSGYSPEPHIHMQVQYSPMLGAPTVAFKFIDYIAENTLHYYSLPKINEQIEAPITDKAKQIRFTFILDDSFKYRVFKDNKEGEIVEFKVNMNEAGEFYFTDKEQNMLYFYLDNKLFYFYKYEGKNSYLSELYKLSPKIPLINTEVEYFDVLPLEFRYNSYKKLLIELLIPFNYGIFNKTTKYNKKVLSVSSKYGSVNFSVYDKGFESIEFKNIKLKRIHEENSNI
jgi:urea transporter